MTVYVTMTDTFLSGWGPATDRKNRLIILCDDSAEARIVAAYAESRGDMKHIGISSTPPSYFHKRWEVTGADYKTGNKYVQIKTKADYPRWFTGVPCQGGKS